MDKEKLLLEGMCLTGIMTAVLLKAHPECKDEIISILESISSDFTKYDIDKEIEKIRRL